MPAEEDRELVILVGMQGSGKTYYCRTRLQDHERISQDEGPRTYQGIIRRLQELIGQDVRKIVIDRTNPRRGQREAFAFLARAAGYRVKIVFFDVDEDTCRNRIRERKGHPTLTNGRMIPAMAAFSANLEMPGEDECDELIFLRTAEV